MSSKVEANTVNSTDSARTVAICEATTDCVEEIASIYNHYVRSSVITLQEEPSTSQALQQKMQSVFAHNLPFLFARSKISGEIVGYAYADDWNERSGYKFTVESSIYLRQDHCGKGIGKALPQALLVRVQAAGKLRVLAKMSILPDQAPEEVPSCRLHTSFGFRPVGRLLKVGYEMEKWIDVIFFQLDIEPGPGLQ